MRLPPLVCFRNAGNVGGLEIEDMEGAAMRGWFRDVEERARLHAAIRVLRVVLRMSQVVEEESNSDFKGSFDVLTGVASTEARKNSRSLQQGAGGYNMETQYLSPSRLCPVLTKASKIQGKERRKENTIHLRKLALQWCIKQCWRSENAVIELVG